MAATDSKSRQGVQANIEVSPDPAAKKVIQQFYQSVQFFIKCGSKRTPPLKTQQTNHQVNQNYNQYYAVKVYYGEINIKVRDPKLVPGLEGNNQRRFIRTKKNKGGPWLIDADEDTVQR